MLSTTIKVAETARDLGVILDAELTMSAHVTAFCRSGFFQLRQLRPHTRSLTTEAAKTLVQAFISCCLNYCNSLLYGVTDNVMRRVQSLLPLELHFTTSELWSGQEQEGILP